MMKPLYALRQVFRKFRDDIRARTYIHQPLSFDLEGQAVSDRIYDLLSADVPCMIGRFGGAELHTPIILYAKSKFNYFTILKKYLQGEIASLNFKACAQAMCRNAGFFPYDISLFERHLDVLIEDMQLLDILGSFPHQQCEDLFSDYLQNMQRVPFPQLEPYFHENPWSRVLENKKVLVVHPFQKTIEQQYARRELLFDDPRVLPKFELKTYKAIQTIAGNYKNLPYPTWFSALDAMKADIKQIDFDIAIIGCGAYGFHLAAHVKRLGKKAVHLGGATQNLFGIRGKRWEANPRFQNIINPYWVRPADDEVPPQAQTIEGGCYW